MATSSQIFDWLKNAFDKEGWSYEEVEEATRLRSIGYPLECKLKGFDLLCTCRDDRITSYAYLRISADKDCRLNVAEYITRANYGMVYGCFIMDLRW